MVLELPADLAGHWVLEVLALLAAPAGHSVLELPAVLAGHWVLEVLALLAGQSGRLVPPDLEVPEGQPSPLDLCLFRYCFARSPVSP